MRVEMSCGFCDRAPAGGHDRVKLLVAEYDPSARESHCGRHPVDGDPDWDVWLAYRTKHPTGDQRGPRFRLTLYVHAHFRDGLRQRQQLRGSRVDRDVCRYIRAHERADRRLRRDG
jgi:hypothetical protein